MTQPDDNSDPHSVDPSPSEAAGFAVDAAADKANEARYANGKRTFLEKWSTTILCVTLFFVPLIVMGSVYSLKVYASDVRQWLPSGFEEADTYDDFVDRFGIDEMVAISWDDCKIDNPQVIEFQNLLREQTLEDEPLFDRVVSGPDMIWNIQDVGVSKRRAFSRVQGLMVGKDNETTCILAYPNKQFVGKRREIIDRIYQVAQDEFEFQTDDLYMGGPTLDGAAIENESKKSLGTYLWMAVVVVFFLTWYRMRDLPLSLLVIFFSALCASISLTILFWTGGEMNLTMVMLPTLTFILGVSGCVHIVNYYRKASTQGYGLASADQAIIDGGYPVALSATTTAVGMLSLAASHVVPIKLFGFYSACGILASIFVMLLILPATLYLLRGRISKRFSIHGTMSKRERTSGVSRSTSMLLNWVCRSHWLVVIPSLIGITLLSMGIFKLKASVKLQNRFASRTKIIQDYQWLEDNLGPLVPMEVVLHFGPDNDLSLWRKMQMVKSVERAIKQTTAVNATLSVATFEPPIPRGSRLIDRVERRTIMDKWANEFSTFEKNNLVKIVGDQSGEHTDSYWRISLRVAALNDIDYGKFLETVANNVDQQMKHLNQPDVTASLTGGIPLVYKAQHQILSDLMYSFCTAFLMITVLLICVLRSFWAGLIAMIPNVFPPLVVFGAMGWLGFSIEIGSVMTASVALGIAVDDTLHFLTWYRRGTLEGMSKYASIRFAFDHCAKAMIDTSMICGLGVLPFVFGVFMPTVKFALLLVVMLLTALLGDLILLPAILAGPAGRLFRLRSKKKNKTPRSRQRPPEPPSATDPNQRIDAPQTNLIDDPFSRQVNPVKRT